MPLWDRNNPPHLDRLKRANTLKKGEILSPVVTTDDTKTAVATGIILLWNDFWEEAHEIAQSDEGEPDHDFLHVIVHRREPDLNNSAYWIRSTGKHPSFGFIAARMETLLAGNPLRERLLADGVWNPLAFNDAIRRAKGGDLALLRALQAEEMIAFHDWLLR